MLRRFHAGHRALAWWRMLCVFSIVNKSLWTAICWLGPHENNYSLIQLTILAQVFCWNSILALNHITQAVEELLWAAGLSWMAALLVIIAMETSGAAHLLAMAGIAGSVSFVVYILMLDIPLYLGRLRDHRKFGRQSVRSSPL